MPDGPKRILVSMQSTAPPGSVWHTVVALAANSQADVECIYMEDVRLLQAALSPAARFLSPQGQQQSFANQGAMRRAIRVSAQRAREASASALARASIRWSFRSLSGAVLTDAFAGAGTGDLAIVPLRADRSNLRQVEGLIDELSDQIGRAHV